MGKTVTDGVPIKSFNGIEVNTDYMCNSTNYTHQTSRNVSYIVMHYTGNTKDTAIANARYFNGNHVEASAHYFVDETSCYQSVNLHDKAWAVGGTSVYKHNECRNANSISIEMCCSGNSIVSQTTISNAAHLCATLCKYLGISASEVDQYVIRHYDVWDKQCPAQWASGYSEGFVAFKNQVRSYLTNSTSNSYLDILVLKGYISNKAVWSRGNDDVKKCEALALIDKIYLGGTWYSEEADTSKHWCQANLYSLCGKGIISNKQNWIDCLDSCISKAETLALIAKAVNNGGTDLRQYEITPNDHWGRNYLNFLCDRSIINTPAVWCDDFEATVTRNNFMALICKAFEIR